jgi:transcription-repair coupling factor (superfamily II helicase)
VFDYLARVKESRVIVSERDEVDAHAQKLLETVQRSYEEAGTRETGALAPLAPGALFAGWSDVEARLAHATALAQIALEEGPGVRHVRCQPAVELRGRVGDWVNEIRRLRDERETTLFVAATAGRAERTIELLKEYDLFAAPVERADDARYAAVLVAVGRLSRGFRLPDAALQVYAEADVFEEDRRAPERRRAATKAFLSDLRDLKVGDLVVHVDHGIGEFVGLKQLQTRGAGAGQQEFLELRYHGDDKLFVPVERLDLIQKYTGAGRPPLDKLGGTTWEKAKTRVKKAMRDMAQEPLKLYAERKARPGHAFAGESPWQREFEAAFEYDETPDQAQAIAEVAADMAAPTPMDRLVCGDVGYGKTEVAMRAAMRAVLDGKQVAVLAPTTVLAFQHWKTFRKRFAPFPVTAEMISRFRKPAEIKAVLAKLATGGVDILIGTHRILSKDVVFRDLGLLVVDEEQRFGVAAKEKLKTLKTSVDCLTLSATPIPRTLQMGLSGIRDMSVIETPPRDRLAIQTMVVKFSTETIAAAVRQELARDGQVFIVHNRVESIVSLAAMVQRLVPEARVVVGHGQMPEAELERVMLSFVEGRADVLVATTIVENGLDIPRANTLIVNRADRYGLAQLYQLRGRVGRADRQAFAYLLVPPDTVLSEIARKRLAAIREFSDLGAGFRIAALDLELRGAGNLLGGQQSGHIEAVGLDLYVKLLEQAILELRGEPAAEAPRAALHLGVDLRIPPDYVPETHQRLQVYKRVSQLRSEAELRALSEELRDRYGPPPAEVGALLRHGELRLRAEAHGIAQVDAPRGALVLRFDARTPVAPERLASLAARRPGARLTPDGLRWPIEAESPLDALDELLGRLAGVA